MPFGLKSAPATMAKAMSMVLNSHKGIRAFAYLDDVIVHSPDLKRHIEEIRLLFQAMRKFHLRISPQKCAYLRKEVTYLGHHISDKGVLPDESKVAVLKRMPVPRNVKEVKSFVAFASYYRKFVKNFAQIAVPLTRLTKKDVPFRWTSQEQLAFETLKNSLSNPPLLKYPDFSQDFNLATDASAYAVGAILSQGPIGQDLPIAFASKTLSSAQSRWSVIERETFGIIFAVKHFFPYIFGRHVKIYTDHRPLTWLFNHKDQNSKLFRWSLELSKFDYEIIYRKGVNNPADHLSRVKMGSHDKKEAEFANVDSLHVLQTAGSHSQAIADGSFRNPTSPNSFDDFRLAQQSSVIMNSRVQEVNKHPKEVMRSCNIE
ncbi:unnamed protein product, partial [Nesidiocoris tenuis]